MIGKIIRSLLVITLAVLAQTIHGLAPVSADVVGTTYTSPQFGYTVTWATPWFYLEESTDPVEGFDTLSLSDGYAYLDLYGSAAIDPGGDDASIVLTSLIGSQAQGMTNYQPLVGSDGAPLQVRGQDHAYAFYTGSYTYDDGTTADLLIFMEAWTSPEVTVANLGSALATDSAYYSEAFLSATAGLVFSGANAGPDLIPDDGGSAGESAPVFAPPGWRVAVAATVAGSDLPAFGLAAKDGRDWWVVILDVTNWSPVDGIFDLRQLLIQTAEMTEAVDLAPSSTHSVASLTGLSPAEGTQIPVAAGQSSRIVVVYSIDTGGTNARLSMGNDVLPIESSIVLNLSPDALPPASAQPTTETGTLTKYTETIAPGGQGMLTIETSAGPVEYGLLGVELPDTAACYGAEMLNVLVGYLDQPVEVETDASSASATSRYIWIVNPDGSRTLLNELLLGQGAGKYVELPEEARFGAWMGESGAAAQSASEGLWLACA